MHARRSSIAVVCAALLPLACGAWKRFAYEGFDRDGWQQPARVIEALELAPGARVADLGAGGGYFTFRLAQAVGPGGTVYAVDVDPDMTKFLAEQAAREQLENVQVVLAEPEDPLLPDGEIDLVLTVNTYHHIGDRVAYFTRLRTDLAPGARVAVLELNGSTLFTRLLGHFTPREALLDEMQRAGYRLEREHDFVDRQTFAVFVDAE
jgi:ubiquinone/menaquinone biosynthesis C-methylase UbiE